MASETEFKGRKLIVIRMVALTMLIWCASRACTGYASGAIEVGVKRHSLLMAGENLWLGYMFLLSSAMISTLVIFVNHSRSQAFGRAAKVAGLVWFVAFGACVIQQY